MTDSFLFLVFFLLLQLFLVCLEASVIGVDDALDESELLCGLCLALWNYDFQSSWGSATRSGKVRSDLLLLQLYVRHS